jgi:hypothetical protein
MYYYNLIKIVYEKTAYADTNFLVHTYKLTYKLIYLRPIFNIVVRKETFSLIIHAYYFFLNT